MTYFKRGVCTLLALSMCLSFVPAFGADIDTGISEITEALEVLRLFEIIPDYYDYNTNFDENVSRADFADAAARLINFTSYSGDNVYFYDVPENHYAYDGISILTEMGIVNGVGEKLFKPDEIIEDAAAYKIVLSLLGYDVRAENDGGYPAGYLKTANRLKLVGDTSNSNYLKRSEMIELLYRALTTEMFITVSYSSDDYNKYEVSENDTLLSMYRDIHVETGIVYGAKMVCINDKNLNDEDEVIIGNKRCDSAISLLDYLGEEVDAFVKYEKNSEKGTVIWAKRTGGTDVLSVSGDSFDSFEKSAYVFSYFDGNNKRKNISIDRSATVILNGREVTKNVSDVLNSKNYSYKLVKNSGKYSTVIVKAYKNYVAENMNLTELVVYDKLNPRKFLKLDSNLYDYLCITTPDGMVVGPEKIQNGSILSLFMSQDKKHLEIVVSTSSVSGVLKQKRNTLDGTKLTIENSDYLVPESVDTQFLKPGSDVTVFLDFSGKVVYADIFKSADFAGYVIEYDYKENGLGESFKLRVLTEDGKVKIFDCYDKLKLDGKKIKDFNEVENAFLKNGSFYPQLTLLTLNNSGLISSIDTAFVRPGFESESSSLSENKPYENRLWKAGSGSLGYDMPIDNSTIFFTLPSKSDILTADDRDFGISTRYVMSNDNFYNVESYKTTDRASFEEYVLIYDQGGGTANWDKHLPILVESIGTITNSDEEIVECVRGIQGGNEVILPSDGEYSFLENGIEKGMLLSLNADNTCTISDTRVIFDFSKLGTYNMDKAVQNAERWKTYGIEIGYVKDVVGDVISVCMDDATDLTETASGASDRIIARNGNPIVIYDTKEERNSMKNGSFADAKTWINSGNECSAVVIVYDYGNPVLFVIYNR